MKTRNALTSLCLCLLFAPAVIADQTIPGSLTVQQGLLIQQNAWLYGTTSFGHLTENLQAPGLWLSVSQDETSTTQTNVITPGYWNTQNVVVEDWGQVDNGYWMATYGTVTVPDYYPAVYDSDGNLIAEGYWGSHDEWQQTGQNWVTVGSIWAVTGTHTEQQQTWVPDVVENVTLTNYGAAHVRFNASRSDTNYDFIFPSASGSGNQWTALSIYGGGMTMTSEDASRSFALTPWSLQHSTTDSGGRAITGQSSAEETQHSAWMELPGINGAQSSFAQTTSHLRADALQFVRAETGPNGNTTTQTQIAARSAQFGGAVTVEGNMNVKGSLRVLPAGDLDMGAFHKGIKPDGTIDNGN